MENKKRQNSKEWIIRNTGHNILKNNIKKVIAELTPREQKILTMRLGLEDGVVHTLEEVGKEFGITREQIRQIETKAFEKIRIYYIKNKEKLN